MRKGWWKRLWKKPGVWARTMGVSAALMFYATGAYNDVQGDTQWLVAMSMMLAVIMGEVWALRQHADARWNAEHGPLRDRIRVRDMEFNPDLKPGMTVGWGGHDYRVDEVEQRMERVGGMRTGFEAERRFAE